MIGAARSGREKIIRLLVEREDIDLDAGGWDQYVNMPVVKGSSVTPLMYAARCGLERIAQGGN